VVGVLDSLLVVVPSDGVLIAKAARPFALI